MRNASQSQSTLIHSRRRGGSPPGQGPSALVELGGRFARFRQEHPRGSRVPGDLRAAALAALRSGVAPGDLYRACGVSWSQVIAWKAGGRSASPKRRSAEATDVRVFSVLDEQPVDPRESTISAGHALELRLGPWSVSVRLVDPAPTGRG